MFSNLFLKIDVAYSLLLEICIWMWHRICQLNCKSQQKPLFEVFVQGVKRKDVVMQSVVLYTTAIFIGEWKNVPWQNISHESPTETLASCHTWSGATYSRLFFWLFFQNSRSAKLNVFQNSSKIFAKLKKNILKLNISETFVEMGLFN